MPDDDSSALLAEAGDAMTYRSGWASPGDSEQGSRSPAQQARRAPAELVD